MQNKYLRFSLVLAFNAFLACGGGPSEDFEPAVVTDLRVDPESVRVGDPISIQVHFEPSRVVTVDSDGDSSEKLRDSVVVLRIPRGIDYVTGSSDFDGSDVHGFRERGPNKVEICADGTRALTYSFSDGELTDIENRIRLSATAFEANGTLSFIAEAANSISIPCDISAEDLDIIIVNP